MRILAVVMFFLMTTAAGAITLESKDAAKILTDQIMTKVASGDIEGGFLSNSAAEPLLQIKTDLPSQVFLP